MKKSAPLIVLLGLMSLAGLPRPAHAQFAVIDVASIAQAIQQLLVLEQQLSTAEQQLSNAEQQLTQAQQQFQSMTGARGMQNLLAGINRNYLPTSWAQIPVLMAGPIQNQVNTNAVLTPAQIAALSPAEQQQLNAARGNAALLQVTAQEAYSTASGRFAQVQQLINAIPSATDQKGILELAARIQAEDGMLRNDATKLTVLYQAAQAQQWALEQRATEQAVAGVGNLRTLAPLVLQ